jgi:hypothetical protein
MSVKWINSFDFSKRSKERNSLSNGSAGRNSCDMAEERCSFFEHLRLKKKKQATVDIPKQSELFHNQPQKEHEGLVLESTSSPDDETCDQVQLPMSPLAPTININVAEGNSKQSKKDGHRHSLIRFSWFGGDTLDVNGGQRTNSRRGSQVETKNNQVILHDPKGQVQPQEQKKMGVVMHGWLEKCGQQFKTWNWRFFVLRDDGVLSYYVDDQMEKLKGSIRVGYGSNTDISKQEQLIDKHFVFMISTPQRKTMISAPSLKSINRWIAKLHTVGATPTEAWDPSKKTVQFFVRDSDCPHEWKRYDDPTFYIHMEGCLMKRGHLKKNWKNRFFRIEQGELRYYTANQETMKGAVSLKGTIVSPGMTQCTDGRKFYFVLTCKDGKFELHLNAHNEQDMHRWIEALQEAQCALAEKGKNVTVAGMSLVVKRAEEIPLATINVIYKRPQDINVELERRTEALIALSCPEKIIPVGSQLIAVDDQSILRETYTNARSILRMSRFPLQLSFLVPPYKKGLLIKKSRSGFENWKQRVIVVANGEIRYYKPIQDGSKSLLRFRKSFPLYGCYLNLISLPGRERCIVVAQSPSDKLVLQMKNEEERIEWASVIYCSICMVSQGITSGHIENLGLEMNPEQDARAHAQEFRESFESFASDQTVE